MWFARAASADIAPSRVAGNPWTPFPSTPSTTASRASYAPSAMPRSCRASAICRWAIPSPSPCCAGTSSRRSACWRRRVCPCPPCAAILSTSRHSSRRGVLASSSLATVRWGSASRASARDPLPEDLPGVVPQRPDPSILQAAIAPPEGWASRTVRVLIQTHVPRADGGRGLPVVRQSREDPVANAARGAQVAPGDQVLRRRNTRPPHPPPTLSATHWTASTHAVWRSRPAQILYSMQTTGLGSSRLNSRPRGRMEVLSAHDPERYQAAHIMACARPILRLAAAVEMTH